MEVTKSLRYRVQVSQTSTGKKSWEATVDGEGYTQEHILAESDAVVAELSRRYPAEGVITLDYKSKLREQPA